VNVDYVEDHAEITADYDPGTTEDLQMPNGSTLRLYKLDDKFDVHDRVGALSYLQRRQEEGEVVTGLLYVDPDAADCHDIMETVSTPLNALTEAELCPGSRNLERVNESFR
jgi:2-oxoglutarate ferredoxin oxidoreductase subunit beta